MKKILTIDGGGLRGIIPAVFLDELEKRLKKPLHRVFDLISGTSTGAVIAGCLAAGVPANVIKDLYVCKGAKLFKRNYIPWKPKYDRKPLMDEIGKQIGEYGKDSLKEAKTKLQINSVDLCSDDNVYFKSWNPVQDWNSTSSISFAIQCSFSAAYYFGSTESKFLQKVFADGGEGNANCTIREAMIDAYKLGWRDKGFYICSAGTGFVDGRMSFKKARKLGTVGQTKKYLNMARRQALRTQLKEAEVVSSINPNFKFDRPDVEIGEKYDKLDGIKYTTEYVNYGKKMTKEYIDEVVKHIRSY